MDEERTLAELVEVAEPAWPLVSEWLAKSPRQIDVLLAEPQRAELVVLVLQISLRSPLGAMAYHSGGLLIDHGWLKILGSGSHRMHGDLLTWNGVGPGAFPDAIAGAFIVALDAVGGVYALNGGAFAGDTQHIFYFAPDRLDWEDLGIGYTEFLFWALNGNIEQFYETLRWPDWQQDTNRMTGDEGLSLYPPLYAQGEPLETRSRRAIPLQQLVSLEWETARQLREGGDE